MLSELSIAILLLMRRSGRMSDKKGKTDIESQIEKGEPTRIVVEFVTLSNILIKYKHIGDYSVISCIVDGPVASNLNIEARVSPST